MVGMDAPNITSDDEGSRPPTDAYPTTASAMVTTRESRPRS
jgi:hypothetical protein